MKAMFLLSGKESARGRRYLHRSGCPLGPKDENGVPLGHFASTEEALEDGYIKDYHPDACAFCCGDYRKRENDRRMREMVFAETEGVELSLFTPAIFIPGAYIN